MSASPSFLLLAHRGPQTLHYGRVFAGHIAARCGRAGVRVVMPRPHGDVDRVPRLPRDRPIFDDREPLAFEHIEDRLVRMPMTIRGLRRREATDGHAEHARRKIDDGHRMLSLATEGFILARALHRAVQELRGHLYVRRRGRAPEVLRGVAIRGIVLHATARLCRLSIVVRWLTARKNAARASIARAAPYSRSTRLDGSRSSSRWMMRRMVTACSSSPSM